MSTLLIKNMVCNRCIMVVKSEIEKLGLEVVDIKLGEVKLLNEPSKEQLQHLEKSLVSMGFEMIDDKKTKLIEDIKTSIIQLVHYEAKEINLKLSDFLSQELNYDYHYLSNLFSEVEGITIEKYLIAQKIERVKELLVYDELSLSEIAYRLHYSSVAYLSNQFKKVTGLSPSHFKKIGKDKRKPLDEV
ncbi:helix-turn-helix transcriptional regulator [Elizabethkingia sp. JS20170427COW]|nr:helix-turn-helix transcriptional regulator [Elizabethkingia sp. JS20170427COW]